MDNNLLITKLYDALGRRDASNMASCYLPDATFTDPAFGELKGDEIAGMWTMLCAADSDLKIELSDVLADDTSGSATWVAHYVFGPQKRPVVNRISATYRFDNGLIAKHTDRFSFHTWAKQALGPVGLLLGWTPFLQSKARDQARTQLDRFMATQG